MQLAQSGFDKDEQRALLASLGKTENADYNLCEGRGKDVRYDPVVQKLADQPATTWRIESLTDRYLGAYKHVIPY